jgi:hypothetical protein
MVRASLVSCWVIDTGRASIKGQELAPRPVCAGLLKLVREGLQHGYGALCHVEGGRDMRNVQALC